MKKKHLSFTKLFSFLLSVFLAASIVFTANPTPVQAAKTVSAKANWKKAPAVKRGTTCVVSRKNNSYIKFKAPAKKTYTITISNVSTLKKQNPDIALGNFYVMKKISSPYSTYLISQKVKTNGGKGNTLFMATNYSYENFHKYSKVNSTSYLARRYAKIKLKKGESLYFKYFHTDGSSRYTINIK